MKHLIQKFTGRSVALIGFTLATLMANAQDKIEVDTGEVKSWLEQNWMWVVAGVVLLLLIVMLSRGKRTDTFRGTRRTTTVLKDTDGHTKSVTTTEEKR